MHKHGLLYALLNGERPYRLFGVRRHDDPPNPDPSGGGGNPDPSNPDPNPNPDPAPDPSNPDPEPTKKTYTQAELDSIIKNRLDRQKGQYKDFDTFKEKAEKFDAQQQANLTELEKEQQARQKAEQDRTTALETANKRLVSAEAKVVATELQFIDVDVALALMSRDGIEIDDDGNVTGVKESLEKLLEAKPHLKSTGTPPPGQSGGQHHGNPNDPKDYSKASDEEFQDAAGKLGIRLR